MLSDVQRTKLFMLFGAVIIVLCGSVLSFGQNSCECGEPSLGTVTCEVNQEPFCVVKSGKIHGRCKTKGRRSGVELQTWVLSEAWGRPVSDDELRNPSVQESLRSGRVLLIDTNGKITSVSFKPINIGLVPQKEDFYKYKSQKPGESARNTSSSGESICEVCVVVSGVTQCKPSAKSESALAAIRAQLCKGEQTCLNKPSSIKCQPQ